jgi:hypothetical protein
MKKRIVWLPVALLAGLLVMVAGSCSNTDGDVLGSGQGQLTISMHDQAAPQISEVWVEFSSIEVRAADGSWVPLGVDLSGAIDIMAYVGPDNAIDITSSSIEPGTYDAIRLTISSARVVLDDGSEVNFPAAAVTLDRGVDITVQEDGTKTVVLHFDVDASFEFNQGWIFDPSISISG